MGACTRPSYPLTGAGTATAGSARGLASLPTSEHDHASKRDRGEHPPLERVGEMRAQAGVRLGQDRRARGRRRAAARPARRSRRTRRTAALAAIAGTSMRRTCPASGAALSIARLARSHPHDDRDLAGGRGRHLGSRPRGRPDRHPPAVDQQRRAVVGDERGQDVVAGRPLQRPVADQDLVRLVVAPLRLDPPPLLRQQAGRGRRRATRRGRPVRRRRSRAPGGCGPASGGSGPAARTRARRSAAATTSAAAIRRSQRGLSRNRYTPSTVTRCHGRARSLGECCSTPSAAWPPTCGSP